MVNAQSRCNNRGENNLKMRGKLCGEGNSQGCSYQNHWFDTGKELYRWMFQIAGVVTAKWSKISLDTEYGRRVV